jgi:hypothetical protein
MPVFSLKRKVSSRRAVAGNRRRRDALPGADSPLRVAPAMRPPEDEKWVAADRAGTGSYG